MIKFLFRRTRDNEQPTWNHDPGHSNQATNWDSRAAAEDANNILSFANPLKVSQSDHYKERAIRRQNWNYLLGTTA